MKKIEKPATSNKKMFNAFNSLLSKARNSELSEQYFVDAKKELKYLCDTLQITPVQCTLLSIILERSASCATDIDDISNYLDTTNMTILGYSDDLDLLKSRHLIREASVRGSNGYIVPQEVIDCFKRDENFVYKQIECKSNADLYSELDNIVSLCSDRDICPADAYKEIVQLLRANSELSMAKYLLECKDKLSEPEFRVLLGYAMFWIRHDDNEVPANQVAFLLDSRRSLNVIASEMTTGTSDLIRRKFIKLSSSEGIGPRNSFCLTNQFKRKLYPEICVRNNSSAVRDPHLKSHDSLVSKPMFYNPGEEEQVSRLHHLLQPENMQSVLARLKDRKMRGGFSILLYGGPGTGKTETVNQLAKESGRALYVVEVDQLRCKWYGESEKLVKGLFDDYRKCVAASKVAPILFFNEADALFNRRMENAERSVDKGENALQNIILQEMENLDGILIATTNLATSLDPAFERRFIYKLELSKPQQQVKEKIWRSMLPVLTEAEAKELSSRYDFSGGQIENIMRKGTVEEILTGNAMTFDQWCIFCDQELITNSNKRPIGFHGA